MLKREIFFGLKTGAFLFFDHAIVAGGNVFISDASIQSEQVLFFSLKELCRNGTFLTWVYIFFIF